MRKLLIVGLLLLLLSTVVVAQDQTSALRDLNERLERNKAEIIKELKDSTKSNEASIQKSIDDNFGVLDKRIEGFFKGATRDIAIIMVAGYLVAFTISQVVKIKIEQMKRKALVLVWH